MATNEIAIEQINQRLSTVLELLTEDECKKMTAHIKIQHLRKNELAYKDGDSPHDMLCVLTGKLKIYKDGVSSRSQLIRVLKPGSFTGHRAYFADDVHHTSCEALEPTTIARIPLIVLTEIIKNNARLAWLFIKDLSVRLGSANERTVNLTQKHVRGRLAETLLFLRDTYGVEKDGCTLSIYLSREDMANMSNMTTSNAIRTLSAFAQENLIAMDGRKIKLINIPELEKTNRMGN